MRSKAAKSARFCRSAKVAAVFMAGVLSGGGMGHEAGVGSGSGFLALVQPKDSRFG